MASFTDGAEEKARRLRQHLEAEGEPEDARFERGVVLVGSSPTRAGGGQGPQREQRGQAPEAATSAIVQVASATHGGAKSRTFERQSTEAEAREVRLIGIPAGWSHSAREKMAARILKQLASEQRDVVGNVETTHPFFHVQLLSTDCRGARWATTRRPTSGQAW